MPTDRSSRIAPEERLVNLVVALMATESGLTKDTILSSVAGYREHSEAGASKDALEKMFERDKQTLRGLGIHVETIGDYADPDDLREARYRIPTGEYELPADIVFSSAEIAVLNLAGGVWSESSISADARSALRKIRALGNDVDAPIIGYSPRISLREAAFVPLQSAIEQARVVHFSYLKAGDDAAHRRRIRPLALVEYEARWHVYGWDVDQEQPRTFLLSRITSEVEITRTSFNLADREGAGERALAGLASLAERQHAHIEIAPGTEAALRLSRRAVPAEQGHLVPYVDIHILADELASYGPEVRVVGPEHLRTEVMSRLERVLALHEQSGDAA